MECGSRFSRLKLGFKINVEIVTGLSRTSKGFSVFLIKRKVQTLKGTVSILK